MTVDRAGKQSNVETGSNNYEGKGLFVPSLRNDHGLKKGSGNEIVWKDLFETF